MQNQVEILGMKNVVNKYSKYCKNKCVIVKGIHDEQINEFGK